MHKQIERVLPFRHQHEMNVGRHDHIVEDTTGVIPGILLEQVEKLPTIRDWSEIPIPLIAAGNDMIVNAVAKNT